MKYLILLFAMSVSFQLLGQNCRQDENVTRFITRGKAALKSAEKPEDYKLAADEFKKALEYDSKCPDIHYNLALCYEQLGKLDPCNYKEAISSLNTYLSLNIQDTNKEKIQEKIYEIEFLFEKAGGMYLDSLVGKWRLFWGDGTLPAVDMYDIEFFRFADELYVKYYTFYDSKHKQNKKTGEYEIEGEIKRLTENTIIQFENDKVLFKTKQEIFSSCVFSDGVRINIHSYEKYEYKLQINSNELLLEGEQSCISYMSKTSFNNSRFEDDDNNDCETKKVYFIKQ